MAFTILIIVAGIFTAGYAALIETYRRWFLKVPEFTSSNETSTGEFTTFSIIIPARNEANIIHECLHSVLSQNYDRGKFEVLLIDDHSTDETALIAERLTEKFSNLKVLRLGNILQGKQLNSYKKKAIEVAVQYALHDWIITTDADCLVSKNWLQCFHQFIQKKNPVFIAAPVACTNKGTFVSLFQSLDFMSLQGITAAAVHHRFHSMCNGANLAYLKKVFTEVGGFAGIDKIASGDDMLLMHKIYKRYPKQVEFLLAQDAIVLTEPMDNWSSFFNQRIRWASKADKFEDKRIFTVLLFIYLYNCFFLLLLIVAFWSPKYLMIWLCMIVAKTFIELRFIYPVATFFKSGKLLWWFPLMQPVHIGYTILAGWLGKFGKYTWKGRKVN